MKKFKVALKYVFKMRPLQWSLVCLFSIAWLISFLMHGLYSPFIVGSFALYFCIIASAEMYYEDNQKLSKS